MIAESIKARLYANWQYAGLTAGAFLLMIVPLVWHLWPAAVLTAFFQLPVYMVHQVEEYYDDRFPRTVNRQFAHGRNAINRSTVLFINIIAVWGVDLLALYLSYFVRPGLGLIACYLGIVNGIVHILAALRARAYNPGLISALLLLIPAGLVGVLVLVRTHQAGVSDQAWGLGAALVIHGMIFAWVYHRIQLVTRTT